MIDSDYTELFAFPQSTKKRSLSSKIPPFYRCCPEPIDVDYVDVTDIIITDPQHLLPIVAIPIEREINDMQNVDFNVGDRVIVSATATGLGENIPGTITDIEYFAGETFISITYEYISSDGRLGICINNLGLITKQNKDE